MNSNVLLECQNLSKQFLDGDRQITAVNQVNLQIMSGEFIVLYGASGSGKTTLLNLLGGLSRPTGVCQGSCRLVSKSTQPDFLYQG